MKEKLFTNRFQTKIDKEELRRILIDGSQLPIWNPAIESAIPEKNGFIINRPNSPFNTTELLTIQETTDRIIYHSREGNILYQLVIELNSIPNGTEIKESFYLFKVGGKKLHLPLLTPVMKKAFAQNLKHLSDYLLKN